MKKLIIYLKRKSLTTNILLSLSAACILISILCYGLCYYNTVHILEKRLTEQTRSQVALNNQNMKKYFDTLFGIQNTLGNAANVWKQQMAAVKDITVGFHAAVRGEADAEAKAEQAINSLDAAIYGDRAEWIQRADAALAAFDG